MTNPSYLSNVNRYAIVTDIGGTNARFCRVNLGRLVVDQMAIYPCANFPTFIEALMHYQESHGLRDIKHVIIAIACPITSDMVRMTNFHWQFSMKQMKQDLGLLHLEVLNDFTAIAMSLPVLKEDETIQVGGGQVTADKPMVVLGAGSGLGVAHLIPTQTGFMPLSGEGGHVTFAPQTEQEWFIQRFLAKRYEHVSWERLLSGPGLENIYLALSVYKKKDVNTLSAADIATLALSDDCELAKESVNQFFACLGSLAGDLALTLGAFGGVYIAGGIVPKILPLMKGSLFNARFEAKGRSSYFNRPIARRVIIAEQPGLIGAAVYLKQILQQEHHEH